GVFTRKARVVDDHATGPAVQPVASPGPSLTLPKDATANEKPQIIGEQLRPGIPYDVTDSRRVNDKTGGVLSTFLDIVVDPKYRNESDMKVLGEYFRYDTQKARFVVVMIFDNKEAAALQKRAGDLSRSEEQFFDQHLIAMYSKNAVDDMLEIS